MVTYVRFYHTFAFALLRGASVGDTEHILGNLTRRDKVIISVTVLPLPEDKVLVVPLIEDGWTNTIKIKKLQLNLS